MLPSPISTPPKNPPALHLPFPPSNKKKFAIPSISRFPRTFWDFWEKGGGGLSYVAAGDRDMGGYGVCGYVWD